MVLRYHPFIFVVLYTVKSENHTLAGTDYLFLYKTLIISII